MRYFLQPEEVPSSLYIPQFKSKEDFSLHLSRLDQGDTLLDAILLQAAANVTGQKLTILTPGDTSYTLVPYSGVQVEGEICLGHVSGHEFLYFGNSKFFKMFL